VLDFECTCEENTWSYLHEVIEFPVVLVDTSTKQIVDTFHRYVRPTENATLTTFCKGLTGIDQALVDDAEPIDTVLHELDEWLRSKDLVTGGGATHDFGKFAFATDGWDLDHFLDVECRRKGLYKPGAYLDRWVDLEKIFKEKRASADDRNGRKKPRSSRRANLLAMLRHHKLQFEGRLHCGADDARNLARVALALLEADEDPLRVNDALAGVDFSAEEEAPS
jgi:3'-5' exoribonuclease 1